MRKRLIVAAVAALYLAGAAGASEQLVAELKTLGSAVDDMSANISTADSDADAELLARVTRETLINASRGYCRVNIETSGWRLWSEARDGKVVDHGATIY